MSKWNGQVYFIYLETYAWPLKAIKHISALLSITDIWKKDKYK